ncbi:MAG: hypothetical protein ACP5O0_06035, partial [Acidimicrobiales bacterium]
EAMGRNGTVRTITATSSHRKCNLALDLPSIVRLSFETSSGFTEDQRSYEEGGIERAATFGEPGLRFHDLLNKAAEATFDNATQSLMKSLFDPASANETPKGRAGASATTPCYGP